MDRQHAERAAVIQAERAFLERLSQEAAKVRRAHEEQEANRKRYSDDWVRSMLGIVRVDQEVFSEPAVIYRALFFPSFDPECCLSVYEFPSSAAISLVTAQTHLYHYLYEWQRGSQETRKRPPHCLNPQVPREPKRWEEQASIAPARLVRFHAELDPFDPLVRSNIQGLWTDENWTGLDGIELVGEFLHPGGGSHIIDCWSPCPDRHPAPCHFVSAIYHLAEDLLHDPRSVTALEDIHGYFDLGLPVKLIPGKPYYVRIFGCLSSKEEEALADFLDAIPPNVPVLVDMTNFQSMGTILYPIFQWFLKRPGPAAWWTREGADCQLRELGVDPARICHSRNEAVASLRTREIP